MTTLDTAAHLSTAASRWGDGLSGAVEALKGRLAAWHDARVTRAALSRLSAHELDDIGLCRADIEAIARGRR